jgi:hypothetical protein
LFGILLFFALFSLLLLALFYLSFFFHILPFFMTSLLTKFIFASKLLISQNYLLFEY